MSHRERERERHTEDGHREVGQSQVNEKCSEVSARASSDGQHDDDDDVTCDRQHGGRRVQSDQDVLVLVRQARIVPLRRRGRRGGLVQPCTRAGRRYAGRWQRPRHFVMSNDTVAYRIRTDSSLLYKDGASVRRL